MVNSLLGFVSAEVVERTDWSGELFSLVIKVEGVNFQAGQFTKLALYDETGEFVRRAYSIVNHPRQYEEYGLLEFLIVTSEDGRLSPLLHQLKAGEQVYVGKEAAGFMTLSEIPLYARDLWMLSTGTAIGPFLSMLEDTKVGSRFNHLVLCHGVRYQKDLVYQERIQTLSQRYPGKLIYVPIVSREQDPGSLSGRIPLLLKTGMLEQTACTTLNPNESFLYLCGNPEMVKDTADTLKNMGYQKHLRRKQGHFSSENYW
ncbi:ferredoxin--NADP reductase [Vibrio sp. HN007]|uniref:ferredoxin--NADP reductase n=1 Tax=Vibrio iocasae TaxID=3098914 RepID=UPI0035D41608